MTDKLSIKVVDQPIIGKIQGFRFEIDTGIDRSKLPGLLGKKVRL